MRIADVVNWIRLVLPEETGLFSEELTPEAVSSMGGVTTITAPGHGVSVGAGVSLSGAGLENYITAAAQDGDGRVRFTCSIPHDLSTGWHSAVVLGGFQDPEWAGSFELAEVVDESSFVVLSELPPPALVGGEYASEIRADGVNGFWEVTGIAGDEITVNSGAIDGCYTGGLLRKNIRIAAVEDPTRAAEQYTQDQLDGLWMFVYRTPVSTSRARNNFSDANLPIQPGQTLRMQQVGGFGLLIMVNRSGQLTAVDAGDICSHDLRPAIYRTLLGAQFSTGLTGLSGFLVTPVGDMAADISPAVYTYEYMFEASFYVSEGDAIRPRDTVAMSSIGLTNHVGGDDTDNLTAVINLRDPL